MPYYRNVAGWVRPSPGITGHGDARLSLRWADIATGIAVVFAIDGPRPWFRERNHTNRFVSSR